MDYNTSRDKLKLPEYGRNVLKMVEHAIRLESKTERNRAAKTIIGVMGNKYPHLRDVPDFKHKLWDHLALMSDFRLDIDAPYPITSLEELNEKPAPLPYVTTELKYRHYGRIIKGLLDKVLEMAHGDDRDNLIRSVVIHMKKTYFNWHNDNTSNEGIFETIFEMTDQKLRIENNFRVEQPKENNNTRRKKNLRRK